MALGACLDGVLAALAVVVGLVGWNLLSRADRHRG
jgi:hypothetical protein